jgi:hypothetical protein
MFLMTFGAVILFDVVATLGGDAFAILGLGAATLGAGGGGAFSTLRLGATTLGAGGPSGACRPAKMAVKS